MNPEYQQKIDRYSVASIACASVVYAIHFLTMLIIARITVSYWVWYIVFPILRFLFETGLFIFGIIAVKCKNAQLLLIYGVVRLSWFLGVFSLIMLAFNEEVRMWQVLIFGGLGFPNTFQVCG